MIWLQFLCQGGPIFSPVIVHASVSVEFSEEDARLHHHQNSKALASSICDAATIEVIEAMAWKQVAKKTDEETQIGVAIFQKPLTNEAYNTRTVAKPEMCAANNLPDAAWLVH